MHLGSIQKDDVGFCKDIQGYAGSGFKEDNGPFSASHNKDYSILGHIRGPRFSGSCHMSNINGGGGRQGKGHL